MTATGTPAPPPGGPCAPRPDADSRLFWDGLRAHRVVLQECQECARPRFPPSPACPYCGSLRWTAAEPVGGGAVYSWIRVHRALDPAFDDQAPYTLAAVDLDGGPRIVGRLEAEGDPTIGDRVTAAFHDHAEWTELRFRPDPDGPTH